MIKIYYAFLCLFMIMGISKAEAQENKLDAVSTAGGKHNAEGISIEFTIGESNVNSYTNDHTGLNEGFQQLIIEDISDVSEHKPAESGITVYPNPAYDEITIEAMNSIINEIRITDIRGNIIYQEDNVKNMMSKINISNFTSGTYFLEIQNDTNSKYQFKIQKIK